MIVADTDVLIDFLAGKQGPSSRVASEIASGNLATTAVTKFELLFGAKGGRQRRKIEALLRSVTVLPLDEAAADQAAEIGRRLEKSGITIGMADTLIAGIAVRNGLVLFSRNRRHFSRVEGLDLLDPSGSGS